MLGQNVDSPATGQFAESKGVPWVGYDSDARTFAPKQWLTAAIYNWGPYYLGAQGRDERQLEDRVLLRHIKDGLTGLAPYGPKVLGKTKSKIATKKQGILSGKFYEFAGRCTTRRASFASRRGKKLTVKDLYAMNWLVKGVIGSAKG